LKRKVLAVTGSRAEYGAMRPVFAAIDAAPSLELHLLVTGMHLATQFRSSREEIEADGYGTRHVVAAFAADGSPPAMARALGEMVLGIVPVLEQVRPDMVLVQGDRGEMLAAAMAAAHMNTPVIHMSGGDCTGSIDDSIRRAITSFAHIHLTTCAQSSERVVACGESAARVIEVGEPSLDVILHLEPMSWPELAAELGLDRERPVILATQHPVTTEAERAGAQVRETLAALESVDMQVVFTYPNTDTGYEAIVHELEARRAGGRLHLVPHLGSRRYLSLVRHAALMVGNSSSGIIEAPSFAVPVVNVGTRQHGRTRACNVIDAGYDRNEIAAAIARALGDPDFRAGLEHCINPYGDGRCAQRTVGVLTRLRLNGALTEKWLSASGSVLAQ
jgi:UDP-N-acetylglucosamine 2-epimerase (non-hydrolysing)/GDP/UDP-N,N'-diacetylbacillosamine 2-epimerase (hydrolysing)